MISRVLTLLGFCQRSGKLVSGEAAVTATLKKERAYLVLVAGDVGEKTKNRWDLWCQEEKIPCLVLSDKHKMGISIGRSPRGILAVVDDNFAKAILKAYVEEEN